MCSAEGSEADPSHQLGRALHPQQGRPPDWPLRREDGSDWGPGLRPRPHLRGGESRAPGERDHTGGGGQEERLQDSGRGQRETSRREVGITKHFTFSGTLVLMSTPGEINYTDP